MKQQPILLAGQATPPMLRPAFWQGGASLCLSGEEIRRWNAALYRQPDSGLTDLVTFPFALEGEAVRTLLETRRLPDGLYLDGTSLSPALREVLLSRRALERVPERVSVGWGIVISPTDLRHFPTEAICTDTPSPRADDLFQETRLRPGTAAALLHFSQDGEWVFLRSADSFGWARCRRIQRCSRGVFLRALRQWQSYVLPLRPPLLLRTAFSRLGTPYRWGRTDCSELVCALYRRFGLLLPRNTGQMTALENGVYSVSDCTAETFSALPAGALLLMPGHVMLFLGLWAGEPYALHCFTRYYDREEGEHPVYSTAVTSLSDLFDINGHSFLTRISAVLIPGGLAPFPGAAAGGTVWCSAAREPRRHSEKGVQQHKGSAVP